MELRGMSDLRFLWFQQEDLPAEGIDVVNGDAGHTGTFILPGTGAVGAIGGLVWDEHGFSGGIGAPAGGTHGYQLGVQTDDGTSDGSGQMERPG
jgi:hypothetical protein